MSRVNNRKLWQLSYVMLFEIRLIGAGMTEVWRKLGAGDGGSATGAVLQTADFSQPSAAGEDPGHAVLIGS
jgi:hypothetical protein